MFLQSKYFQVIPSRGELANGEYRGSRDSKTLNVVDASEKLSDWIWGSLSAGKKWVSLLGQVLCIYSLL
jgi:hypothetical protein